MDFDWQKYLLLAEKIKNQMEVQQENSLTEALKRTAVSRAYYAMFHFAQDFAQLKGYVPTRTDAHNDLRLWYMGQRGDFRHQQIRPILARMHKYRKECDYEKSLSSDIELILESMIVDAREIKNLLST